MTKEEREEAIKVLKAIIPKDSRENGKVLTRLTITKSIFMAIEALEQELCDKCIYSTSKGECQYDDIAKTIPTEQESKWIPVTTPPTRNDRYFVTRKCLGKTIVDIVSYSTDLYKVNKYEFYDKKNKGGWWSSDSEYGSYEVNDVIGWQELPMTMKSEK